MPRASFTLRRFRPEDAREIATLFYETIRTVNVADYDAVQIAAWAPAPPDDGDVTRWRSRFEEAFTVVAEGEGSVILGYADLEASSPDAGHLDHLYVHREHQGFGIATALLQAIEDEAIARGFLRLLTEASLTARPFFARRGFTTIAEQTVVVRGVAMPNVRMEKRL